MPYCKTLHSHTLSVVSSKIYFGANDRGLKAPREEKEVQKVSMQGEVNRRVLQYYQQCH